MSSRWYLAFLVSPFWWCAAGLQGVKPHHPYYYPPPLTPALSLPLHHHGSEEKRPHCLKKICDQVVTGRQLPYIRILQIIHQRLYLDAIHLHLPGHDHLRTQRRRKRRRPPLSRQKRQGEAVVAGATSEILHHGMNHPLLVGIPLFILSAMFLASLRKRQEQKEVIEAPTIVHHEEVVVIEDPPLVPPHVPQPGQPGGGYIPDPYQHHQVLSLVPQGLVPVAVFPSHYGFYGDSPSQCVLFAEAGGGVPVDPVVPVHHYYSTPRKKHRRRKRFTPLLYGFRCVVTIVDQKVCNTTYQCQKIKDFEAVYGHGYFFNGLIPSSDYPPTFHPHLTVFPPPTPSSIPTYPPPPPLYYGRITSKRSVPSVVEIPEFWADSLPQCRIEDSPKVGDCSETMPLGLTYP